MNSFFTKCRHKLKGGKTTRPFSYDLNQIPHKYTVEVTNRFKRPDLRVTEEIWIEVWDIVQEAVIKTIPMKKKCKKAKWLQKGKKKKKRGGGIFKNAEMPLRRP